MSKLDATDIGTLVVCVAVVLCTFMVSSFAWFGYGMGYMSPVAALGRGALTTVGIFGAIAVCIRLYLGFERRFVPPPPGPTECFYCRYSLEGLADVTRCPECGKPIKEKQGKGS